MELQGIVKKRSCDAFSVSSGDWAATACLTHKTPLLSQAHFLVHFSPDGDRSQREEVAPESSIAASTRAG